MATEVNENTKLTLDLKTIILIVGFTVSLVGMYYNLSAQISEAMRLPEPEVSKIEFSYKDEITRATIEGVQISISTIKDDVSEIKAALEKMDGRLYEISKTR